MAPAFWNDRARSGFIRIDVSFPRDVELEPCRTSHDGVGGALFIRLRRTDDGAVSDTADPGIEIAEWISDRIRPEVEQIAKVLTWGADEHIVCALAAGWWLYCRHRSARHRTDRNHILLTTVAVTLLPHLLKSIFDQERPDRLMSRGHLHGVPISALDAFPSGHAIHVGAQASAATMLPPAKRNLAWSIGVGLVLTRIVLLAHWTSDVIAGLAIGAAVERLLRRWTGFGLSRRE